MRSNQLSYRAISQGFRPRGGKYRIIGEAALAREMRPSIFRRTLPYPPMAKKKPAKRPAPKRSAAKPSASRTSRKAASTKRSKAKPARPAQPAKARSGAKKPAAKASKSVKQAKKAAKPPAARPMPKKQAAASKPAGKAAPAPAKPKQAVPKRPAPTPKPAPAPMKAKPTAQRAPKPAASSAPPPAAPAPAQPPRPKPTPARAAEKRAQKERVVMEFMVHSAPNVLYELISSPSGFSEWYCDDVDVRGDQYTFKWDGDEERATLIGRKAPEVIRFHRNDDDDEAAFFEFRIRIDDMTNEVALIVTDHAWPGEVEATRNLWTSQIANLARVLGA